MIQFFLYIKQIILFLPLIHQYVTHISIYFALLAYDTIYLYFYDEIT